MQDRLGKTAVRSGQPSLLTRAFRRAKESIAAAIFFRSCSEVGAACRAAGRPIIRNAGRIVLGSRVRIISAWTPVELDAAGGEILIGDEVAINYGTLISAHKLVRIGNRVQIGNLCIVADTEQASPTPGTDAPQAIEIGDDVWLAVRVTVLPGARIGSGSVITAGSIVSGVIPPRVVAGGVPARVLRALDEPEPAGELETAEAAAVAVAAPDATETALPQYRGLIASNFTVDDLAPALRRSPEAPRVDARVAPFNQIQQTLLAPAPAQDRDFLVVWTRPEGMIPSFGRLLESGRVALPAILEEVDAFCDLVAGAASQYKTVLVPTWTMDPTVRGLGLLDGREGATRALAAMNLRLMDRLAATPNVYALDTQRWIGAAATRAYQPKPWYMGKLVFPGEVMTLAARDIKAALATMFGLSRKVVVVDLDDTVWGGTVGEVGWQKLRVGGVDPEGEAFADFQRQLKALSRRGILLAIASKNDERVALEALNSHPEMVLRQSDFAAWRIHWGDKAQSIADLARTLNLGLQSFVFIDNDAVQRARVREALPEVLVPEWPLDVFSYRAALDALSCFDTVALTDADASRTELYARERERDQLRRDVGSVDDWLKSLDMRVRVEALSDANIARVTQLLNKTNQMNLTTRRLTAEELRAWTRHPDHDLWAVTVADRFGDAGLTGIVSLERSGSAARIVDFVLSCRVMGRHVENAMLHVAVAAARERGLATVEAVYRPTAKNRPCLDFLGTSGFTTTDGQTFVWSSDSEYPLPNEIALDVEQEHTA